MKIFISYGNANLPVVKKITSMISGIDFCFWDKSKEPGEEAWPCIFKWIDECDLVFSFITNNVVSRAMSVGMKIGHAKAKNKYIIPLVAPDVASNNLGCLQGITYETLSFDNVDGVVDRLITRLNVYIGERNAEKQKLFASLLVIVPLLIAFIFSDSKK